MNHDIMIIDTHMDGNTTGIFVNVAPTINGIKSTVNFGNFDFVK